MAEYYRSDIRSAYDVVQRQRNPLLYTLDWIFGILSALTFIALILTLIAPLVYPSGWLFPILSLLAPATFVLYLLFTLYWIIRWRWIFVLPMLLLLVVSLFRLDLYLNLPIARDHGDRPAGRQVIRMISYNVRQFYGPNGESTLDSIASWLGHQQAHIVCLQEFTPRREEGGKERFDSLINGNHLRYYSTQGDTITTLALYSRYKILRSGRTQKDMASLRSIWADLVVGDDTLRVYNNHLHTTAITRADDDFLSRENFLQDTAREQKVRSIVRRFRDNSIARAAQADSLYRQIEASPYAAFVVGDFNDTPLSYTYHRLSKGRQDAFCEEGRGYSHTFCGFNNALRIDFLLLPKAVEVLAYEEYDIPHSDHRPVMTWFKRL